MDELFRLGLTNAAWATVLVVAATAGARLWRSRPALVHVLWLLVLIKLVTPSLTRVDFPVPASAVLPPVGAGVSVGSKVGARALSPSPRGSGERVPEGPERGLGQGATKAGRPAKLLSENQDQVFTTGEEEARTAPRLPIDRHTAEVTQTPPVELTSRSWPWRPALLLLWLGGVTVWFVLLARTSLRFRRLVRSATPAPADLAERATRVAARLGLHRVPTIGLVPARVPPMLWASITGPARLILPAELWCRLDAVQQDAVLAHELAHLKRRDHWVRRLEAVVLGLYWWYPGAWWARRQLERAEEECCDAWVVWVLPSAAGSYAEALVATAAFLSGLRQPLPLGASGAGRTRPLKRRLAMILCDSAAGPVTRTAPLIVLTLGLLALPFLPALASGQQARAPGTDAPAPAPAQSAPKPAKASPSLATTDEKAAQQGGAFKMVALDPTKPDKKTRVCQVVEREVSDYVDVSGRLEAAHTAQLRPRVSGMIIDVRCHPGEIVKVDDLLFQIDARPYRAELDKADAEVRRVEARLKRVTLELGYKKKLRNDKVISSQEVELAETDFAEAEASLRAAKADRDLANLKLDATQVRAPVAGRVTGSVLDAGSVVTADSTPLAAIVALDPMHVVFRVGEDVALRLKRDGQKRADPRPAPVVAVHLAGEEDSFRKAQVNLADLQVRANASVAEVLCRATLANHDGILFPGLSAQVRVTTSSPHKVLLVPETAILRLPRGLLVVAVVNEKNEMEKREVQVGLLYDGLRVVTANLKPGEWVMAGAPPRRTGFQ